MTMHISFSPVRSDHNPVLERRGDTLLIDGETFDFSVVPEGAILPCEAINSEIITSDVVRRDGVLCFSVMLPHTANAPRSVLFPRPVFIAKDGIITLPAETPEGVSQ